jgi:hypothetical protein
MPEYVHRRLSRWVWFDLMSHSLNKRFLDTQLRSWSWRKMHIATGNGHVKTRYDITLKWIAPTPVIHDGEGGIVQMYDHLSIREMLCLLWFYVSSRRYHGRSVIKPLESVHGDEHGSAAVSAESDPVGDTTNEGP